MASLDVLLVMALKEESQGQFEAAGLNPFYCGMGAAQAAHYLTRWIFEHQPKQIINLGTAGSRLISTGSLVECTSFIQRVPHSFLPLPSTAIEVKPMTKLKAVRCGSADFVEPDVPITKCEIFDMESYAMAFVCQRMNVKFNAVKYISDQSNKNTMQDWKKNLKLSAAELLSCYREII
ncbi:MAG: hypothetical protein H7061_03265 [Bdellovibrionaceae bacterium]|nr:hypothetical protein [Bdellovibrio sp.]